MNFAHMVGEHSYDSGTSQLVHTVFSWSGLVIAVMLGIILVVAVYSRNKHPKSKEDSKS